MERVSSSGLNQIMLRSAMSLQAKLADKEVAQSSGLTSETYAGLGAASGKLISMESTLTQLQGRSDTTQTALDRTEAMYSAVGSMVDIVTTMRNTLSSAKSDTTSDTDYASIGAGLLEDLQNLMNLQSDGRYLFGGSQTQTAPVDTSLLSTPSVPSSADTGYYTGDDVAQSVKISDQTTIEYGVTANGTGFEEALRAANILANLGSGTIDQDAIEDAYDIATDALDGLLATQGLLSVNAGRLESYQEQQDSTVSLLSDRISDVKAVDTAQVAVEISQYQNTLEASYSALAKVTKLNLLDYM